MANIEQGQVALAQMIDTRNADTVDNVYDYSASNVGDVVASSADPTKSGVAGKLDNADIGTWVDLGGKMVNLETTEGTVKFGQFNDHTAKIGDAVANSQSTKKGLDNKMSRAFGE